MAETQQVPIVLPDLGAGDQPVRLSQWLVEAGDYALEHDRVAEVLVGGLLFHVASPAEGIVSHVVEQEGTILHPDQSLGFVSISSAK